MQGHKVNGVPLCTPVGNNPCFHHVIIRADSDYLQSVYADIALSVGDYLQKRPWCHLKDHKVVVDDMEIEKALIAAPRGPQLLGTFIDMDTNETTANMVFCTVDVRISVFVLLIR